MGLLKKLREKLFGASGGAAASVITAVPDAVRNMRNTFSKYLPPDEQAAFEVKMIELENQALDSINEVNKLEAQHTSVFVAGWRPFIGWVLGVSCAVYFPPRFALGMFFWAKQVISTGVFVMPPELGIQDVLGLLASMFGFAGLRSIEKTRGVQGRH